MEQAHLTRLPNHEGATLTQLHDWAQSAIRRFAPHAVGMGQSYGPVSDRFHKARQGELEVSTVAAELWAIRQADGQAIAQMVRAGASTIAA